MNIEEFLHDLHFDVDKIRPPDLEVDWEDAPIPYKLYRGQPVIPLCSEVPLTLEEGKAPAKLDLPEIGHFLWYAFGLTQLCQSVLSSDGAENGAGTMHMYRRFAPSGGALYPSEVYVYLKIEDVPHGVYHYDVAHHRLVQLREGDFDSYLAQTLGHHCNLEACFGAVFVSTMFWKNFYKYNNFAYRLQGLDAGALIGQMLEVAKRFGFASGVYFQFLDQAVNHLLGLSTQEESVVAVVPLSVEPVTSWFARGSGPDGTVTSAAEVCGELPTIQHNHYVKSRKVSKFPLLQKMNEASLLESTRWFRQIERRGNVPSEYQAVELPHSERLSLDLALTCRERFSPGTDFVLRQVSQEQLATLLQTATTSFTYLNNLDGTQAKLVPRVSLYGCLYGVEGIPDGAYYYDSANHVLRQVRLGDHRLWLQQGMSMHNVNLSQVPLCMHVVGDLNHLIGELGYRGYRIQQMEAGMLVQRVLLTACAIGLGGHPLLGFDAALCDEIYKLAPHGKTNLIQIPVGTNGPPARLQGGLHG